MKTTTRTYTLLLLILLVGCSTDEPVRGGNGLWGTWRLYEEGSGGEVGVDYFTAPVPATPLQSLTFTNGDELRSQGSRLTNFFKSPYYRTNSTKTGFRLQFLASRKDTTGFGVGLSIKGDTMRITPACIEGCHYGFVRIR
ncbi:MAG: hypothetical protein H7Z72_21745 [Bacteroidetes bacterium]|nr:hypothetical protein [Fibrella sp.]